MRIDSVPCAGKGGLVNVCDIVAIEGGAKACLLLRGPAEVQAHAQ